MKRIHFLLPVLLFLITLSLQGQKISVQDANRIGYNFLLDQARSESDATNATLLLHRISPILHQAETVFYVVQFEPSGWVLVSADQRAYPVAAYALAGSWSDSEGPWSMWIREYAGQILEAQRMTSVDPDVRKAWQYYDCIDQNKTRTEWKNIQPMLLSTWNQGYPYNTACPPDPAGPGGHAVTGCVATACAQLMYYFRFPKHGSGSYAYTHPVYGNLAVDFSAATYDYSQMLNATSTYNAEMAKLAYHFGVSVDMVYGPNSSGMYNHKAAYSLRTHFNFSPATQYVFRDSTNMDWDSLLVSHLERRIPMYYAGWAAVGSTSGHAFICDGYQSTVQGNFYHFNWGWGGSQDGYFYTNNLTPGGSQFTFAQELIINAYPDTLQASYPLYCQDSIVLTAKAGTLEDGSGPARPYKAYSQCSWLIMPQVNAYDSIQRIELVFNRLNTEQGVDKISVYQGGDATGVLIGTYSGTSLPPMITVNSNKAYITFVSNGSLEYDGFLISYKAVSPSWCSGLVTYSAAAHTFDDGSGSKHYNNGNLCTWLIQPASAAMVYLSFDYFDTEPNKDILRVYNYNTQQLLGAYSGSQLPPDIQVPGPVYLEWVTNQDQTANGWQITYTSSGAGIDDLGSMELDVYPNPCKDHFYLILKDLNGFVDIGIFDVQGMLVHQERLIQTGGTHRVSLGKVRPGIYFVVMKDTESRRVGRLAVIR